MLPIRPVHYVLISPVHLLLVALIAVPCVLVLWQSFSAVTFGQPTRFVGLDNYVFVLGDPSFWRAFVNTFLLVNTVVYLEIVVALAIAMLFAGGAPLRGLLIAVVLAPYAVSEVVAVIVWKFMLEPEVGIASQVLGSLGLPELEWTTNRWAGLSMIGLINIWLHLPFTFIILYSALLSIPGELYEAGRMDGAGAFDLFRHITLPLLMPAILIAMLFRFVFAFRIFSEVWLLTEGGPFGSTEVLATYLYRTSFRYYEFGKASAIGWLMLIFSLIIAVGYLRRMYKTMLTRNA